MRPEPALVAAALALAVAPRALAADSPAVQQCLAAHVDGQRLRAAGQLTAAREKLLACAQSSCPRAVSDDCTPWLGEVEAETPSVVLRAKSQDGRDLDRVTVTENEKPIVASLDGKEHPLDPGPHTLRFAADGAPPVEVKIVLSVREKGRPVEATIVFPEAPKPPPPPPPTPRAASTPVAAWAFSGVAIVGVAGTTIFGLSAKSKLDDARKTCAPYCPTSTRDAAHRDALVADVSLGVAVVGAGLATYFFLRPRSDDAPAVSFGALPSGAAASVAGRF